MEASDVFAGKEIDEDVDPFEGTDFGDFDEPEGSTLPPEPERPRPEADLPVVDREGQRVEAVPDTHMTAGAERAPAPEPAPTPDPPPAAAPAADATAGPAPAATPATPSSPPAESAGPTEDAPDPIAASPSSSTAASPEEPSSSETGTAESSESSTGSEDAAPPSEKKDKTGRVTHRRYLILKVEGNGRFSTVTWYEDKQRNIVAKGSPGAKRQKYALARGQEDALKIGYAALGAPPKATIVAVALSSFQERTVEPEPPQPERARLKIS